MPICLDCFLIKQFALHALFLILFSNSIPLYYSCLLLLSAFIASQVPNKSLIYSNYSNLGENNFPKFPTKGLENVVDLKTHNNPNLVDFPKAHNFPKVQNLMLSYAYHCCQFMPSTYENLIPGK